MHDHPWSYGTHILSGGYHERTPEGTFERKIGEYREASATDLHQIVQLAPDTWTLFLCSSARRVWGFATQFGWESWQKYLGATGDPNDNAGGDPDSIIADPPLS